MNKKFEWSETKVYFQGKEVDTTGINFINESEDETFEVDNKVFLYIVCFVLIFIVTFGSIYYLCS